MSANVVRMIAERALRTACSDLLAVALALLLLLHSLAAVVGEYDPRLCPDAARTMALVTSQDQPLQLSAPDRLAELPVCTVCCQAPTLALAGVAGPDRAVALVSLAYEAAERPAVGPATLSALLRPPRG